MDASPIKARLRQWVEALCSEACAGRAPGSPGGQKGRRLVAEGLRRAGLQPFEQEVPGCDGANVLAALPGRTDRWVILAAHHDHLGHVGGHTYWGADDNAAAVAALLEAARGLAAAPPRGRGVLFAAFDGEEPPHFLTAGMGSEHWARHPTVPLEQVDLMVCMDLVGHALGQAGLPESVRETVFALGGERGEGVGAHLDRLAEAEPGVRVRRMDASVVPPLSDYDAFWRRRVPFTFLTCGRWQHYHTPEDTPDKLDYAKLAALSRWLERFVRESCERPEPRLAFRDAGDDASTARTLAALTAELEGHHPLAAQGRALAEALLASCDARGLLPKEGRAQLQRLVGALEQAFG